MFATCLTHCQATSMHGLVESAQIRTPRQQEVTCPDLRASNWSEPVLVWFQSLSRPRGNRGCAVVSAVTLLGGPASPPCHLYSRPCSGQPTLTSALITWTVKRASGGFSLIPRAIHCNWHCNRSRTSIFVYLLTDQASKPEFQTSVCYLLALLRWASYLTLLF